MAVAFLVLSLIGLAFTINAFRPLKIEPFYLLSFFAGWLTSELPLHHLVWQLVATVVFVALGALHSWPGWVALGVTLLSWVGLIVLARRGVAAGAVVDAALGRDLGLEPPAGLPTDRQWKRLALPFRLREPDVERVRDLAYVEDGNRRHLLDVYRPAVHPAGAPVLLYIHGGGWVIGNKEQQGLPLIYHLASRGWVCVTINYRLSPKVRFPEHLIDCKRALAWVKEHIAEFGGDPGRVAVSGGSAGGHLAALVALTPARSNLQPGFEDADLRVQAAVPFYGVYDFRDRDRFYSRRRMRFFYRVIMGATPSTDPDLFALVSPIDQVREEAPPFLVVHGANDSLVTVREARSFVTALRARSHAPVVYAELPGAQHAFEVFRSIRTAEVVPRVEVFLRAVLGLGDPGAPARDRGSPPPAGYPLER